MRFTIKVKLALAFGALALLSIAMASLGIASLASLNQSMDDMLRGPVEQVRRATALRGSLVASSRAERSLLLANTDALVRHYLEELDLFRKEVQTERDELEAVATPEEKRKLAAVTVLWDKFAASQDKVRDLVQRDPLTEARVLWQTQSRPALEQM